MSCVVYDPYWDCSAFWSGLLSNSGWDWRVTMPGMHTAAAAGATMWSVAWRLLSVTTAGFKGSSTVCQAPGEAEGFETDPSFTIVRLIRHHHVHYLTGDFLRFTYWWVSVSGHQLPAIRRPSRYDATGANTLRMNPISLREIRRSVRTYVSDYWMRVTGLVIRRARPV